MLGSSCAWITAQGRVASGEPSGEDTSGFSCYQFIHKEKAQCCLERATEMASQGQDSPERDQHDRLRPEVSLLQEMFPALHTNLLTEILRYNKWDLAASADAALAWSAAQEDNNTNGTNNGTRATSDESGTGGPTWTTSPTEMTPRSSSGLATFSADSADSIPIFRDSGPRIHSATVAHGTSHGGNQTPRPRSYLSATPMQLSSSQLSPIGIRPARVRGVDHQSNHLRRPVMTLSDKFLVAPRFRLTVHSFNDTYTEFSILFNRTNSSLGLTIASTADMAKDREPTPVLDSEIAVMAVTEPAGDEAGADASGAVSRDGALASPELQDEDITFYRSGNETATAAAAAGREGRRGSGTRAPLAHSRPADRRMKHIGFDAGVKKGDVLTGVDDINLAPGAEIGEVELMLKQRPGYVTLHFRRRKERQKHHRLASLLMEQNIISEQRADYVTKCLQRIRLRVLSWDSGTVMEGGEGVTAVSSVPTSAGGRRGSLASELYGSSSALDSPSAAFQEVTPDSASAGAGTGAGAGDGDGDGASSNGSTPIPGTLHSRSPSIVSSGISGLAKAAPLALATRDLRPALATRILRAKEDEELGHMWYVVWVMDVKSGQEWTVRRRFSEFWQFREVLMGIRPSIKAIEFPPKRYAGAADDQATVTERMALLHKFLRKTASIVCVNRLHPSTEAVHRAMQDFLDLGPHMDTIAATDQAGAGTDGGSLAYLRVFLHACLQMTVMDRVLDGFLDNFASDAKEDVHRDYTADSAKEVLYDLRDFMHNLHGILLEGLCRDGEEVLRAVVAAKLAMEEQQDHSQTPCGTVPADGEEGEGEGESESESESERERARQLLASTYLDGEEGEGEEEKEEEGERARGDNQPPGEGERARPSSKRHPNQSLLRASNLSKDDIRVIVKEALRKQVEVEVYLPCARRVNKIMNDALCPWESQLARQVAALRGLPQSFFGITVDCISPSSWEGAVEMLAHIRSHSLPQDRLAHLIDVCKAIPAIFSMEHPHSRTFLGADDFLPIFIYVLVGSRIPHMLTLHEEMLTFVDADRRMGEAGYYLATLEAAISHIRDVDPLSGEGMFARPAEEEDEDEEEEEEEGGELDSSDEDTVSEERKEGPDGDVLVDPLK